MSGHSPIDSLRRLAPVSDADAAAVFGAEGREALLADLTHLSFGRAVRRPPVTRRRRLVLAAAVLAVAGIATAATWVALDRAPARETTSVQCLIGSSDSIIPSFSGNPVHDCVVAWRQEYGTAPPALRAYDNGLGGVTVIPASRKPPAGWKPLRSQDVSLIELQDSLDDYIAGLNASCLDSTAAMHLAEQKLTQLGFAGWTVKRRGNATGSTGTCFDMDIVDPASQTVTVGSFGAPAAPGSTVRKLADKLRPLTQGCESLPAAVAATRRAADSLGLSEAKTYDLQATTDDSLHCASVYETVGGTIFLTVRGPRG
jgi:hypothetical protein